MQHDDVDAATHGAAALASLREHGLAPTPRNYAVWYEFHAGRHVGLRRAMAVALSQGRRADDLLMAEVHEHFLADTAERQAAREARATLREAAGQILEAGADATRYGDTLGEVADSLGAGGVVLASMVARLAAETTALSAKSTRLGQQLHASSERVAELEKRLAAAQQSALTDALTNLPNRRAFEATIREAAGLAMNTGEDLCLLMIDIDRFKRINDAFGHAVGDAVIRVVAAALVQHREGRAVAARYGGEEFAMLLPATPLPEAVARADRLRSTLAGRRLSLRANDASIGHVTVSIGAARYEPGEAIMGWIERADAALYRAKQEGRNRVVVAEAALMAAD